VCRHQRCNTTRRLARVPKGSGTARRLTSCSTRRANGRHDGGGQVPNLKKLDPSDRVQQITYCKDTYTVTTANGETHKFWERNLRLKTDASSDGPEKTAPALIGAGMMGDRADIIFSNPSEISAFIAA